MTKKESFDELMIKFNSATVDYEHAHSEATQASGAETTAINRLSAAQKALNEHFASLKDGAQWNTYWHQEKRHGHPESG